jgi:hypothetical protein
MHSPGFALLLALVLTSPASAEIVLDQEYALGPGGSLNYYLDYPGDHLAQTFTVKNSGILTSLGIQVSLTAHDRIYDMPIDDLHISVVRVDSNGFAIISDVLAKGTISPIGLPVTRNATPGPMANVDISSWNARVNAGDQLAITFASEQTYYTGTARATNYMWFRSTRDNHPGGRFSIYSPKLYGATPLWDFLVGPEVRTVDAGFQVYVDVVPEPSSLLLTLASFSLLSLRRRSR